MARYMVDVNGELPNSGVLAKARSCSVSILLDDIASSICEEYCKYNDGARSEMELYKYCDKCPLNML